jgi:hypothetical protein
MRKRERERGRERGGEREGERERLTRVRACFMLARVRSPYSGNHLFTCQKERERERERERDKEGERQMYNMVLTIAELLFLFFKE